MGPEGDPGRDQKDKACKNPDDFIFTTAYFNADSILFFKENFTQIKQKIVFPNSFNKAFLMKLS